MHMEEYLAQLVAIMQRLGISATDAIKVYQGYLTIKEPTWQGLQEEVKHDS